MTDDRMTRTALLDALGVLPATLPVYFGLHNVRIDPNAGGKTSHVLVQELIAHLQEHTCNHDVCVPLFDVIGGLTLAPVALGIEEVHDKIAVVLFCAPEVSARRELLTLLSDLFGVPSPNWNQLAGIRERELNAWWRTLTVRQKELVQAHWIMATMLTWLENPEHFKQLLAEAKERKNEREA